MNKFGKILMLALSFGVLALVLSIVTTGRVAADKPTQDVNVVGTVPVTNPGTLTPIPLVVSNTDGPGHTPVQGSFGGTNAYMVPADKRLVIEYASGSCVIAATATVSGAGIQTTVGGLGWNFFLPFTSVRSTFALFFGPVHVYADPGTKVDSTYLYSGTGSVSCSGYFAGYLTNP